MTRLYLQIRLRLAELAQASQNKGVETIEWVGIAAVVVAIITAIIARNTEIGNAVVDTILGFIQGFGGG
jgi:hypothetical protein